MSNKKPEANKTIKKAASQTQSNSSCGCQCGCKVSNKQTPKKQKL